MNAPHAELVPDGLLSDPVTPLAFTTFSFLIVPAAQELLVVFTQARKWMVQAWFGVVMPSWSQAGLQSSQEMLPPFSSPVGTSWKSARQSLLCAAPRRAMPTSAMAPMSATAKRESNFRVCCRRRMGTSACVATRLRGAGLAGRRRGRQYNTT